MSKFKHDLLLRLIKLVDAVLMTIPFALCWYLYYSDRTASSFDEKGNLIVVLLFLVLFIIFGRIYDAFMMSIQQISEIVYAQFLAVAVSDLIIYVVICLLSKGLTNLLLRNSSACRTNHTCIFVGLFGTSWLLCNISRKKNSYYL